MSRHSEAGRARDYAGSESGTKNTGMVRAYSNAEAASSLPFVGEAGEAVTVHGLTQATADDGKDVYTAPTTADKEIAGASFPTTGTQTYEGDKRKFSGTYMGGLRFLPVPFHCRC